MPKVNRVRPLLVQEAALYDSATEYSTKPPAVYEPDKPTQTDAEESTAARYKGLFSNFLENSAWNGFPNISRAKHSFRKFVWTLLVLGSTGMMIFHTYSIAENYLKHPTNTVIDLRRAPTHTFPAVTICNRNPVFRYLLKAQNLSASGPYYDLLSVLNSDWNDSDYKNDWINEIENATLRSGGNWSIVTLSDWTALFSDNSSFTNSSSEYSASELAYLEFADLDATEKEQISTTFRDLIVDCSYGGIPCTNRNFSSFQDPTFGNCYVFNPGIQFGHELKHISRTGSEFGLEIKFFVQQEEYISQFSQSAGIRVAIHDQNQFPHPHDHGFDVSPGFSTSIALKKVKLFRLKSPFRSDCMNYTNTEQKFFDAYAEEFNANYSIKGCLLTCYQSHLISRCNCTDPVIPKKGKGLGTSVRFDSCFYGSQKLCLKEVKRLYEANQIKCSHCKQPCLEINFEKDVSYSEWPSVNYMPDAYTLYLQRSDGFRIATISSGTLPELRRNAGRLLIYFADLNLEHISEKPQYDSFFNFLAELGGTIGLWTGLSVIGMFEVLELIVDIFRVGCCSRCEMCR